MLMRSRDPDVKVKIFYYKVVYYSETHHMTSLHFNIINYGTCAHVYITKSDSHSIIQRSKRTSRTFFERSTPRVQESHKAHAHGGSNFSMWAGIIIVGNLTRRQQHFVVAWCLIALIRAVLHRLYNKKLMRLVLGIHDGVDHLDTAWRSCGTKIAQGERKATNGYMNVTRRSREN